MQPEIRIFAMWDPDSRWVGNEDGYAPLCNFNEVNYTAETAFGEQVSLLCGTTDGARYVRGEAEGRPHFEALATLSPFASH